MDKPADTRFKPGVDPVEAEKAWADVARLVKEMDLANGSVVYAVQGVNGGPIKIGRSTNLRRRIEDLESKAKARLRCLVFFPGGQFAERRLHRKLKEHRLRGEWFADCPDVHAALKAEAEK